ncbi:MAG: hypothetical protein ACYTEL_22525 [Planctomycetota bacterium]|jgi:hypothetical protein
MEYEPPVGSKIRVERTMHGTTFAWKEDGGGIGRYGIALFLLFWLCLWTAAEISAIRQLIEDLRKGEVSFFLIFWLGGWTVGGAFALCYLYSMLRPRKPTVLTLSPGRIEYRPGIAGARSEAFGYDRSRSPCDSFEKLRKKVFEIETSEMTNLKLERIGERQRLSFDYGASRVIIGLTLSDPEKQWLYEILRKHTGTRP